MSLWSTGTSQHRARHVLPQDTSALRPRPIRLPRAGAPMVSNHILKSARIRKFRPLRRGRPGDSPIAAGHPLRSMPTGTSCRRPDSSQNPSPRARATRGEPAGRHVLVFMLSLAFDLQRSADSSACAMRSRHSSRLLIIMPSMLPMPSTRSSDPFRPVPVPRRLRRQPAQPAEDPRTRATG